jgi:hypothetical protein
MAHSVTKYITIEGKEYKIRIGCPFYTPHYQRSPFECSYDVLINDLFQGRIECRSGFWYPIDDFITNWDGTPKKYAHLFKEAADFQAMGEMVEMAVK